MKRATKISIFAAATFIAAVLLSPPVRFRAPCATVVEARDGSLLGARIAADGQWRFPGLDSVPVKFEKALLTFEDKYFYWHPGINPVAIVRALRDNIKAGVVVSGGSTITMQAARISRGSKTRSYPEKVIEMLSAVKLEMFRSKKKILSLYANNAPFGGNIVGLEAATWRYLGKRPEDMTWAEAASLAVLPNAPSLVFPGRNQERLREKRDDLLRKMYRREYFDSLTLVLSLEEPLPGEPKPLPDGAQHLTDYFFGTANARKSRTTIDPVIQERANEIIKAHQTILSANFIHNSACIIVKVSTGEVLAYVGNSPKGRTNDNGSSVDIIRAERSTGSILKPILYAGMQQEGLILPNTLIPDIPTRFPGFSPKNFDMTYSGAIPASQALSQSLNIPAVRMLRDYTSDKLLMLFRKIGFTSFTKPADYYGLSLILGGGESSLWELAGVYSSLSRVLCRYNVSEKYSSDDYHMPYVEQGKPEAKTVLNDSVPPLSASAIWLTCEALRKVNRPESEAGWQYFSSSPNLAWKTGTSFGFRDAWAVGTTPDYVIAVWAGNADGEGRPGLTGVTAAAPILFDLVNIMGPVKWFSPPSNELTDIKVCSLSGQRAGNDCPETIETQACISGLKSEACPYHRVIHLDRSGKQQVNADCLPAEEIRNESWFVLPPAMEYFYRQRHTEYRVLPPWKPGCNSDKSIPAMEFIYPTQGVRIFIPRDQTGELTRVIAEVAHRNPSKKIFWHLDNKYLTTTRLIHQAEILAPVGDHVITAVDEDGNVIKCGFAVTGK